MKLNSVQKAKIPGREGQYFVATSEDETSCPHFPNRREARAAGKTLREAEARKVLEESGPVTISRVTPEPETTPEVSATA